MFCFVLFCFVLFCFSWFLLQHKSMLETTKIVTFPLFGVDVNILREVGTFDI